MDYDQELFDALRELCSRLAAEKSVPPYVIFGDATLQQMAHYMPQSRESLLRISGVGARKLEDLGDAFLSVIVEHARSNNLKEKAVPVRRKKGNSRVREAGSTYDQTKQLLQQGMTVEEVAQQRGLAKSTIAGHIERLIQAGEQLDLSSYLPPQERYDAIRAAFVETGGTLLSSVKAILGDDYSYDEIQIVGLYLDQQGKGTGSPTKE